MSPRWTLSAQKIDPLLCNASYAAQPNGESLCKSKSRFPTLQRRQYQYRGSSSAAGG